MSPPNKKSERPPKKATPALSLDLDEVEEKLGPSADEKEEGDRPTVAPPFDLETFAKEGAVNSRTTSPSVSHVPDVMKAGSIPPVRAPQATLTDETELEKAREQSKLSNFPIVNTDTGTDSILSLANARAPSIVPPAARPAHAFTPLDRGWGEELDDPMQSDRPAAPASTGAAGDHATPMPGSVAIAAAPALPSFPEAAPTRPSLDDEAPTSKRPITVDPPPPPGADSKRTPTLRPEGPAVPTDAPATGVSAKPPMPRRKTQIWGAAEAKELEAALSTASSQPSPAYGTSTPSSVPAQSGAVAMPEHTTPFPTSKNARDMETARAETQAVASSSPATLAANVLETANNASSAPRATPVTVPKAETIAAARQTEDEIKVTVQPMQATPNAGTKPPSKPSPAKPIADSIVPVTQVSQAESSPPPTRKAAADPVLEMKERFSLGDYTGALVIAEALLEDNPSQPEAKEYAESCRQVLQQMYTARIGPLDRIPMVMVPRDQLRWLSIDHKAGFLLSHVDGISSLEMILDVSGMPVLDTLRILCELSQQRIISFR